MTEFEFIQTLDNIINYSREMNDEELKSYKKMCERDPIVESIDELF